MIVGILYYVIKLLRFADSNKIGMDKLFFFVRKTTDYLTDNVDRFNQANLFNETGWMPDDDDSLDNESESEDSRDAPSPDEEEESDEEEEVFEVEVDPVLGHLADDNSVAGRVIKLWQKRLPALEHDYSIAGWLLSVDNLVFEDAKNHTEKHMEALRRVAEKLFTNPNHPNDLEVERRLTRFEEQFQQFRDKAGPVFSKERIWTHSDYLKTGESYLWHNAQTRRPYPELGEVACRVTSKTLGIGSAERSWGDTKLIKSGQRSHISSARAKNRASCLAMHVCKHRG